MKSSQEDTKLAISFKINALTEKNYLNLIVFCLCYKFSRFSFKNHVLIVFNCFEIFKKIHIKSEIWADCRHFGFLEVADQHFYTYNFFASFAMETNNVPRDNT